MIQEVVRNELIPLILRNIDCLTKIPIYEQTKTPIITGCVSGLYGPDGTDSDNQRYCHR